MKRRKIGAFGMYIKLYVGKKCHQVFFLLLKNAKVCGPSQKKLHGNTYEKKETTTTTTTRGRRVVH